eukprot:8504673-Lingulodinium_polyedra.AAC.1
MAGRIVKVGIALARVIHVQDKTCNATCRACFCTLSGCGFARPRADLQNTASSLPPPCTNFLFV